MKAVVVGGVAGGMSFAARARRLAEDAEIVVLERDPYVSYANCGLPYHLGGEIGDRDALLLHTPQSLAREPGAGRAHRPRGTRHRPGRAHRRRP